MTLPLRRFTGLVYRAHHPRWAHAPESGDGARAWGGRFNRRGTSALYTALSVETAWLEAQQGFAFKAQPLTLCSYDVDCADVVDLTDATVRREVVAPLEALGCPWEDLASRGHRVPSWTIAERLTRAGCAGVIVPSFAARATVADVDLVFWRWSRTLPHLVAVIDDEGRLPRDQRSWRDE